MAAMTLGWWFVLFSHVAAPPCFRGEWSGP
jgi:hypothetical protein